MPRVGDSVTIGQMGLVGHRGRTEVRIGDLHVWLTAGEIKDLIRVLGHALDELAVPRPVESEA